MVNPNKNEIELIMRAAERVLPDENGSYRNINVDLQEEFLRVCSPARIYGVLLYTLMLEEMLVDIANEDGVDIQSRVIKKIGELYAAKLVNKDKLN